jgi:hypothetical protein
MVICLDDKEVDVFHPAAIVMAVDNCELPKDASEGFGSMFMVRYSMLF